eukprot:5833814-Pyramimonas_sp.AAC.1
MDQIAPKLATAPSMSSPLERLRRVDMYDDPGAWETLDEGCNSKCHGRNGLSTLRISIGGNASSETIGKKAFPYRICADGGCVSGSLESHELRGQDHVPSLLSLPAQAKLGLTRNLSKGSATIPCGEVELCRCARSGLLVVRIDQFQGLVQSAMGPSLRPLHISFVASQSQVVQTDLEGSSDAEEVRTTFAANKGRDKHRDKDKHKGKDNDKDKERSDDVPMGVGTSMKPFFKRIETYTMGLDNFESHLHCSGSAMLIDHIHHVYKVKSSRMILEKDIDTVHRAIVAAMPRVFSQVDQVAFIDCRGLNDPTSTRHIGYHPNILEASVENDNFNEITHESMLSLFGHAQNTRIAVIFICKSGRHRSVACECGFSKWLMRQEVSDEVLACAHLSEHEWNDKTCGGTCSACEWRLPWADEEGHKALSRMETNYQYTFERILSEQTPSTRAIRGSAGTLRASSSAEPTKEKKHLETAAKSGAVAKKRPGKADCVDDSKRVRLRDVDDEMISKVSNPSSAVFGKKH